MTHRPLAVVLSAASLCLLSACHPPTPAAPPAPVPAPVPQAVTPPPPRPDPTARLHFAVYGDCRDNPAKHQLVVEQMAKLQPQVVLQTGDLVGNGEDEAEWKQALRIIEPLRAHAKYYGAMGNHEKEFVKVRDHLSPPADPDKSYYTALEGNCRFIVLDSTTLRLAGKDQAQLDWLKRELAKPRGADELLFVVLHHPPYSIGSYYPGDLTIRKRLHQLFVAAKVAAVWCGHDHGYYRTLRDGVMYVVAAGGGAPLYEQHPDKAQPGDVCKKTLNFVDCVAEGAKVHCTTYDQTGTKFDEFELPAKVASAKAAPATAPE